MEQFALFALIKKRIDFQNYGIHNIICMLNSIIVCSTVQHYALIVTPISSLNFMKKEKGIVMYISSSTTCPRLMNPRMNRSSTWYGTILGTHSNESSVCHSYQYADNSSRHLL